MFIKCFSKNDYEKLLAYGFQFFKKENDDYIFINDSTIQFTNGKINVEVFSDVYC